MSNGYLVYWSRVDSTAHCFLLSVTVSQQSAEKLQGVGECHAEVAQVLLRKGKNQTFDKLLDHYQWK